MRKVLGSGVRVAKISSCVKLDEPFVRAYLHSVYDPNADLRPELQIELSGAMRLGARVTQTTQNTHRSQTYSSSVVNLITDDTDELARMAQDQANCKHRG